ncbi:phage baseplate assembly protein W [Brevibacillus aydinogluensis]|uniref:hypothetical protein n=1 Tax=Brevibacillus aydinogluensis TaxID=927786 RepID=UPI002892C8A1|nr:hypothetical protein [Brevibacillus aydinogluensis]MDT3416180.1 phage baseplate assembly protein W [Brevibacillus aydinogluensis]
MIEYEVTATDLKRIDFGATGVAEILQNIRMILATTEFSCPMDRGFAWNPDIDAPIPVVQARTAARLVAAIQEYEPRAEVVQVSFQGEPLDGKVKPIVKVRIKDDAIQFT